MKRMRKCTKASSSLVLLAVIIIIGLSAPEAHSAVYVSGIYNIVTALNSNKVLDVYGARQDNRTNIQIYDYNDTLNQQFEFVRDYNVSGVWYKIVDQSSKKVLDVAGGVASSGVNVQLYEDNGTAAQLWQLESAGRGYYFIKNKLGYYLDVDNAGTRNETNVQVYWQNWSNAQKFKLQPTKPYTLISDSTYVIKSALNTNMAVDVYGDRTESGTNIQLWEANSSNAQKFVFSHVRDGYYKIEHVTSGKVLDVDGARKRSGTNIALYDYHGGDNQLWRFYKNGDYYFIRPKLSKSKDSTKYCLASYGFNVQLGIETTANKARYFKLEETEPVSVTQKYYVTTRAGLNLRSSPSTYANVLLTMPYLSEIDVSSISNGWAFCTYNGTQGYCSSAYIQPVSDNNSDTDNADLPPGVFFTQEGQTTCTLSSAAMMLRTRAYQLGKNWQGITESSIRYTAWINGTGLRWSFTYDGMSVAHASYYSGMTLSTLKSLLDRNPAGIVLYCSNLPHAVWVISVSGDTVYCADPLSGYSGEKISLEDSYLGYRYSSQSNILSHVNAIWYVQ